MRKAPAGDFCFCPETTLVTSVRTNRCGAAVAMIECTGRVVMPDRTRWESRPTAQSRVALHCLLHRMRAETFATGILKISGGRRTNLILIVDEQPKSCGAS